jgi:nucleoside-diphosphate-sugar epimerase
MKRLPDADLRHVLERTEGLWADARERRFLLTGGTGFIGRWLAESLVFSNDSLALGLKVTILTRDPEGFRSRAPHLADHPAVTLLRGDVRRFIFPAGEFAYVLHGAFDSSSRQPVPQDVWDTIVHGTERVLEFAGRCKATGFLLVSSGAVYGPQPPDITHLSESFPGAPPPAPEFVYGEAKRAAELLSLVAARELGLSVKIARGFAFVGPLLPLDAHFAIGNFIADALAKRPIRVLGDGTPCRSYLYAADLAIWLLTILFRGRPSVPYNVGSEREVTIAALARIVAAAVHPPAAVEIAMKPAAGPPHRYVPSTQRAHEELGLEPWIGLSDSIRRTADWYSVDGLSQ